MIEVESEVDLIQPSKESISIGYYLNSTEHLFAELERIDLLLQYHLIYIQKIFNNQDYYKGLYIAEQDVERAIHKPIGQPWWHKNNSSTNQQELKQSLDIIASKIRITKRLTEEKRIGLNLEKIVKAFGLSNIEKDILLLALSPEIDLRYQTMFAYLQDDITKKHLSVDLLINLLGTSTIERVTIRQYLSSGSNLVKYQLIELVDDSTLKHPSLLNRIINVSERVVNYLLDLDATDRKPDGVKLASWVQPLEGYFHPKSIESINKVSNFLMKNTSRVFVYIQGLTGSGRRVAASMLAQDRDRQLLNVSLTQHQTSSNAEFESYIFLVMREAMLENADLYFSSVDEISAISDRTKGFYQCLSNFPGVVYFEYSKEKTPKIESKELIVFHFKLLELTTLLRMNLWQASLTSCCEDYTVEDITYISERFRFTPDVIRDVILSAKQISNIQHGSSKKFCLDELHQACRLNSNRKLETLAKCIVPKYQWNDIILEEDKLRQLQNLYNTVRYRTKVFEDWGFAKKLSLGKGANVLFTGSPGTGKTMAAEIVAGSLGLDLYKIDLSTIVSKYIGETEKNLAKIFKEAETSNAILFFDEADALFSKRTEIKSSNDRHSNAEVAFLLQRMEEFDGITILATNLRKNIDEAFVRRLAFIIKFPFPGKQERLKIWQAIWPEQTPLAEDVNFEFMANQFKLAGGNIKNIAIASSFLAAENGESVGMKHLVESTKREFEKQGKTSVKTDFGPYGELLR